MLPLFWLRVALSLYGVGLLYALASFWGGRKVLTRITMPAVGLGMVFHFVSLVESSMFSGTWTLTSMHSVESVLGFVLMVFFFIIYARYRATSPGVAVFPLVFWLTFSASSYAGPSQSSTPLFVSPQWIFLHVTLILIGYSALFFSFTASILYLIQERRLKSKTGMGGLWSRLPALATIDEIGLKCLIWGFPFMTLGLISGSIVAEAKVGSRYFADPMILLSGLMWVLYMVLLYTRWNAGWRGRRAAYLAAFAFAAAVLAWAANYFRQTHRFLAS